jgi:hypothetical protein
MSAILAPVPEQTRLGVSLDALVQQWAVGSVRSTSVDWG